MEITLEKGITAFLGLNIEYNMTSGYLIVNVPTMIHDIVKRFSKYMIKESITSETMIAGASTKESWGKVFPICMMVTARA